MPFRLGAWGGIIDGSGKGEAVPQFSDSIEISRPIAGRDVKVRWATSLQKLRDQVHAAAQQAS